MTSPIPPREEGILKAKKLDDRTIDLSSCADWRRGRSNLYNAEKKRLPRLRQLADPRKDNSLYILVLITSH